MDGWEIFQYVYHFHELKEEVVKGEFASRESALVEAQHLTKAAEFWNKFYRNFYVRPTHESTS